MYRVKNLLELVYSKVTISSPPFLFCWLINFRYKWKKVSDRVEYQKKIGLFRLSSENQERFFYTKFQNYNSYKNGVTKRDQILRREYLLDNINLKKDDVVVDCGANIGDFWHALNDKKKISFNYFAFEPSGNEFKCLELNVTNNAKLFNLGLWDKKEELIFYISSKNADSSLIKPESFTNSVKLEVDRLDNVIKSKRIKLLKLEAEGAEMQVLMGSKNILKNIHYITADLGLENDGKSTLPEVTNYLLSNGFEILKFGYPRVVLLFKNRDFQEDV